jgi:THO complex subunit 4
MPRRREGRRPGARRERGERSGRGGGERIARDGRPKKTQEELDAEMEDYFGGGAQANGNGATTTEAQDDIDMIE